jgi:hypothetical protein
VILSKQSIPNIGTKKLGEALCKNLKIETKIKTYKP